MGSNRDGFGAVVDVRTGSLWQSRLVTPGSFLASGPPEVLLSFGAVGGVEFFRITWPSGIRQTAVDLEVGRALHMDEKGLNSS